MVRVSFLLLLLISALTGCVSQPDPRELIYIGTVSDKECATLSMGVKYHIAISMGVKYHIARFAIQL